ncbi:peptidoglycan-binding domain-containing protein [Streptomyces sp. NPDC002537]
MSSHERHTPSDDGASASEQVAPLCRTVPEPASHRRRLLGGRRVLVLATLGVTAIPVVVVGAISELDRSSSSRLSPQSKQRPELPDREESGPARGGKSTREPTEPARTRPTPAGTRTPGEESVRPTGTAGPGTEANTPPSAAPSSSAGPRESTSPQKPPPSPSSPGTPNVLRQGDSGSAVEVMQHMLHQLGLYHGHRYGHFDDATEESVRRFQTWAAVADDVKDDEQGTYGPATRTALVRWASWLSGRVTPAGS